MISLTVFENLIFNEVRNWNQVWWQTKKFYDVDDEVDEIDEVDEKLLRSCGTHSYW